MFIEIISDDFSFDASKVLQNVLSCAVPYVGAVEGESLQARRLATCPRKGSGIRLQVPILV
ncbi:hypothetical protein [Lysinibacillus contaminans]|uniref:hypothetical protein n=1 Tax=Lysinibacillus contaminans TaxID=1293441 RepID=UPI000A5A22D7|nr:hypothetical protein [Lysinibacillus contaminans]